MLVGLGDMNEDSSQELEWVGHGVVIELMSSFGLKDEQPGAFVEAQSGKVDRRPHEVARQLVQALGV